jgi:hypothetical protein
MLLPRFTVGSSAGCEIKAEVSWDNTTFYQVPKMEISSTVAVMKPVVFKLVSTYDVPIDIPVMGRWCRVGAKALTSGTSCLLSLTAVKGNI